MQEMSVKSDYVKSDEEQKIIYSNLNPTHMSTIKMSNERMSKATMSEVTKDKSISIYIGLGVLL